MRSVAHSVSGKRKENNSAPHPTSVEHACARCQDQTSALHMFCDTNESESCSVKAPAKHASELVLVVGELLCTGVQANTERHTRKGTREMCSCWGYKQQHRAQTQKHIPSKRDPHRVSSGSQTRGYILRKWVYFKNLVRVQYSTDEFFT